MWQTKQIQSQNCKILNSRQTPIFKDCKSPNRLASCLSTSVQAASTCDLNGSVSKQTQSPKPKKNDIFLMNTCHNVIVEWQGQEYEVDCRNGPCFQLSIKSLVTQLQLQEHVGKGLKLIILDQIKIKSEEFQNMFALGLQQYTWCRIQQYENNTTK